MNRIIAGDFKNTKLEVPESGTRPITDRAKAALFSILGEEWIEGSKVLDLYAGSGSLGLEALSRGADFAVFVDQSKDAAEGIRNVLEKLEIENFAQTIQNSVEEFFVRNIKHMPKFDVIFMDPPYDNVDAAILNLLHKVAKEETLVVLKHAPKFNPPEKIEGGELVDTRKYGQNLISFYLLRSK